MFKYLIFTVSLLLVGCSNNQVKKELVVEYQTVEKIVVQKCEIPKIDCDFRGEGFIPTEKLLECVIKQKRALEICTE